MPAGRSAMVVISTPLVTSATRIASRMSSCCRSRRRGTISVRV